MLGSNLVQSGRTARSLFRGLQMTCLKTHSKGGNMMTRPAYLVTASPDQIIPRSPRGWSLLPRCGNKLLSLMHFISPGLFDRNKREEKAKMMIMIMILYEHSSD